MPSVLLDSSARLSWLVRLTIVSLLALPGQLLAQAISPRAPMPALRDVEPAPRDAQAATGVIRTVAGDGNTTYVPAYEGGPAIQAGLSNPAGVAVDSHGNFYVADTTHNAIREVTAGGIITTVLTTFSGRQLNSPYSVALDAAGDLYIADTFNNRVLMITAVMTSNGVTTGGVTSLVAGTSNSGYTGDGGLATQATLSSPIGLALDSSGNLYIADTGNNVVRMVNTSGTISTVAGNGTAGYSGDNGPATVAELSSPEGVAFFAGSLYIADNGNSRVRQVTGGTITTFAGNGTPGYSGDGGAPTSAMLVPFALAVDAAGNLYAADSQSNVIRKIAAGASGTISTAIGTGTPSFAGDGGVPTSADINMPQGIAVDANGSLFVADSANNRIRRVTYGAVPAAVTVTPSPSSLTTAQALTATINVNGGIASPQPATPAGSVTLSAGSYTSASPVTLDATGNATITVPAFSLDAGSDILTVTYTSTDTANYTNSTGTSPVTVTAVTPTVTVAPASLTISQTQSLAVTVTVSGGSSSAPTVTGSIVLTSGDGVYTSSSTALANGTVTVTIPPGSLSPIPNTLTASYTPDTAAAVFYAAATGANPSPVVVTSSTKANPTVVVTPSATTITSAQPLTVTVMVGAVGTNPQPTGSVSLTSSSYSSPMPATLVGGMATFMVPAGVLAPGINTLSATYTPDSASAATYNSAQGSTSVSVGIATATVKVSAPANVTTAQSLVITVAVSGGSGAPIPTGSATVTLSSGTGGYQGTASLNSTGVGTLTVPPGALAPNTYSITAKYSGDAIYGGVSATAPNNVVITRPTPTLTVMPSASSITNADPLVVAVTVNGGPGNPVPYGSVTLSGGGYTTPTSSNLDQNGNASIYLPYGVLAPGTDTLTVTFTPGDKVYNGASGTAQVAVTAVLQSTPAFRIEAPPPSPPLTYFTAAQAIAVNVILTGPPGFPAPTGAVSVTGGGYTSPMPTTLDSSGSATLTLPPGSLAPGVYTLTETYTPDAGGSALYTPATGTVSVTVTAAVGFTVSSGGSINVASGSMSTAAITVTPVSNATGSFSGQINLSCTVTTSLTNYSGLPTCQLGGGSSTTSVTVSGTTPVTTMLTVTTTPAAKQSTQLLQHLGGGLTLAGLLLLGIPARRYRRWSLFGCLFVLCLGLGACSSSSSNSNPVIPNSGTTAGTYLVTVTGTDAATGQLSSTSTLNVIVN